MNDKKLSLTGAHAPMRTSGSWAKSNERVLVIGDSDEMRAHLVDILSPEGFVVFDQPSAIGATRSIRENGIRAVVVDVGVPGIRGEKLVSVLRENPRLEGLIVVVVLPEGVDKDAPHGLEAANAILERHRLEYRLPSLLGRLLRNCSFRPHDAATTAEG